MSFKSARSASNERRRTAKRTGPHTFLVSSPYRIQTVTRHHTKHINHKGPIRLATVSGGLALAWFWTWFPYPMTESTVLRRSTAKSLYLMANYYSALHETFKVRARGEDTHSSSSTAKDSPGYRLDKARSQIYSKTNLLLASTRAQAQFVRFDIPIGGSFPRQKYAHIIDLLQDSLNYMALISIASASFLEAKTLSTTTTNPANPTSTWLHTLQPLIGSAALPSQALTSLLALLSAALAAPQPLPPHLDVPAPWALTARLDALDADVLSVRHVAEPGYASLAVVQIAQRCLVDDLRRLLDAVRELVGELDFSWTVIEGDARGRQLGEGMQQQQNGGEKMD
nr:hypothetical protein CFP56_02753 [Quercus suber]